MNPVLLTVMMTIITIYCLWGLINRVTLTVSTLGYMANVRKANVALQAMKEAVEYIELRFDMWWNDGGNATALSNARQSAGKRLNHMMGLKLDDVPPALAQEISEIELKNIKARMAQLIAWHYTEPQRDAFLRYAKSALKYRPNGDIFEIGDLQENIDEATEDLRDAGYDVSPEAIQIILQAVQDAMSTKS